jgi:hypothetical protein
MPASALKRAAVAATLPLHSRGPRVLRRRHCTGAGCSAANALEQEAGAATWPPRSNRLRVVRRGHRAPGSWLRVVRRGHRARAGCGCCDTATALQEAAGGATRPMRSRELRMLRRGHRARAGCRWCDAATALQGAGCGCCDAATVSERAAGAATRPPNCGQQHSPAVMCWKTWPWRRPALDERAPDRWQQQMPPPEPLLQRWLGAGLGAPHRLEPVQETTAKRPTRR